jgi:hypothetical protein
MPKRVAQRIFLRSYYLNRARGGIGYVGVEVFPNGISIGFARPTTHRDFYRGKLKPQVQTGLHNKGRFTKMPISREAAEALYLILDNALYPNAKK